MKKLAIIFLAFVLAGCATGVPIKRSFPDTPEALKQPCPDLQTVAEDNTKLSELMIVVTSNYKEYNNCQIKVESWLEWYQEQKKIFESAN